MLFTRHSVRVYEERPVPRETVLALLAATTAAPSAHNRQPWRFVVLESSAARQRLAQAMGERWRTDRAADAAPPAEVEAAIARSHQRIAGAPLAVLACLTLAEMDPYPDPRRRSAEHTMAVQSVAAAVQNLLLAAQALGLGACWMCAPLFCPGEVRAALDLPADWEPQALVTLGYPAEPPVETGRAPLDERVRWR